VATYAVAIRKDVFFEAGGFPEAVKSASVEDELLGVTIYSGGHRILLAKDISVTHLARIDFKTLIKKAYMMSRDGIEFIFKYQKQQKTDFRKNHHHPSLIVSMLISPLIPVFLIASFLPRTGGIQALIWITVIFLIINLRFFLFVAMARGAWFGLKSVLTYYLFCLTALLGCARGGINYLLKK